MTGEKIRILHVQAVDAIGGTERTNYTLLAGMDRQRFANEICILGAPGPYRGAYAAQGIPAHYLHHSPAKFARLLRRNHYDLLFLYGLKANLLGRLLGPLLSQAVRVEVKHGIDMDRGWLARALDRYTSRLAHFFISNSQAAADMMAAGEGKSALRTTVIHNGIDPAPFARQRGAPDNKPGAGVTWIAVANLRPCKGHRYLLEAVGKLKRKGIGGTLLLVGDGPERPALERLAQQVAPGAVQFLGHRSDIAELLAGADLLVQPSWSESLPNSVMEAMAAGLPVVATDVGGMAELVQHGETGLLVPPRSADALAGALATLTADPALGRQMGQAGAERIRRHFPLEKMVARFEAFCLEHARPPRPDILFLATTGMAARYLIRDKIDAATSAGYRVRVLVGEDRYVAALSAEGLPVDTLRMSRFFRPLSDLRVLWNLVCYLRRKRPRLVHSCTPKAGLLGPLAARLAGIPAVHGVFGLLFHDRASCYQNFIYRAAERLTALCSEHLLFQSQEDLKRVLALGWKAPNRLHYLGNGIDLGRFNPTAYRNQRRAIRAELGYQDEHFVVGLVARLLRTKGLEEFLVAAEKLLRFPSLRFLVIGPEEEGHAQAVDRTLLCRAAEAGNLQFLGERQDMPRLYAAMDLLVLPSYREGVPRSLLEGSAMELPVIASDIRGCREVVIHQQTGWLVPVRDAEALAERIVECWRHPGRARQLGLAGAAWVRRHFDQRLVHRRLLRLYREWLGAPSSRSSPEQRLRDESALASSESLQFALGR